MSKTALLCWERGYHPDQTERLPAIARHLSDDGWTVVLAVKDTTRFATPDQPGQVLQSPVWPVDQKIPLWTIGQVSGLAGWLRAIKFGDPATLRPILRAWGALFDIVRPDLIIADDAPGAVLAARNRIPCLTVGSGIKVMPDAPDTAEDTALTDTINQSLAAESLPEIAALTESQRGARSLIFSFPSMDIHADQRRDPYCLPVNAFADPPRAGPGTGLLFHLGIEAAQSDVLIAAAMEHPGPRQIWSPDLPDSVTQALGNRGLEVLPDQATADAQIHAAALVIHSGGPARAMRLMAAGVPQLLIHNDSELRVIAGKLAEDKIGLGMELNRLAMPDLLETFAEAAEPGLRTAASGTMAAQLRRLDLPDWPDAVTRAIADI